jgi:SulP family sulfate permease
MFIDKDVLEIIHNFKHSAVSKGTIVQLVNIRDNYDGLVADPMLSKSQE